MANQFSKWLLALSLSGCLSMPPTQFYVLEPLSEQISLATTTEKKRSIGIGPITIPALLERKQLVTRLPDNTVTIAEFHQWASPLKDNIAQVLTYNLATLQTGDLFRTYPWSAYGTVNYRIIIDIIKFDIHPNQNVNFVATWAIMHEKTHALVSHGRSKIDQPLNDSSYTSVVKVLSKILGDFSQELSLALEKIPL
ncbi:MAG: hypothetical protein RI893_1201 [Pseudomonadota bacterium]|jgi:uncharacterized lipoprotein YmbA